MNPAAEIDKMSKLFKPKPCQNNLDETDIIDIIDIIVLIDTVLEKPDTRPESG